MNTGICQFFTRQNFAPYGIYMTLNISDIIATQYFPYAYMLSASKHAIYSLVF